MANPLNALSSGNQGNAEGLQARQNAFRQIGGGVLRNQPAPIRAPKPPSAPSPVDKVNSKAQYGDRQGEKRIDVSDMTKPIGSYKKGGKVKKTGVYRLHKKERVLNPKQAKKFEKRGGLSALMGGK